MVEGIHVLEIILAIFESIATDIRVESPQLDHPYKLEKWLKQPMVSDPKLTSRDYEYWLSYGR
jgi:hypothetical protein